ncbi:MAG: hypothetical protein ACFNNC_06570, partial [Rothia dentocariosa]
DDAQVDRPAGQLDEPAEELGECAPGHDRPHQGTRRGAPPTSARASPTVVATPGRVHNTAVYTLYQ